MSDSNRNTERVQTSKSLLEEAAMKSLEQDSTMQWLGAYRGNYETGKQQEPLSPLIQTMFVFAARYVHSRNTGGAYAVTRALKMVWPELSERTRKQILEESEFATANISDWEEFRRSV